MDNEGILIDFSTISPFLRYIHQDIFINKAYHVPWRILYDYELVFVYEGTLVVETETEKYTVVAGECHIMPPFVHHHRYCEPDGSIRLYSIHFDISYQGNDNDFSANDIYVQPCNEQLEQVSVNESLMHRPFHALRDVSLPRKIQIHNPTKFMDILNNTLESYEQKAFGYELDMKVGILQLLRMIIANYHDEQSKNNANENSTKISWCLEYIRKNYAERIDFIELANSQGISQSYFRKLFKAETDKAPTDYLICVRIEKAIDLLRKGTYSIGEICKMVGYDDIHHFSKLFKEKTGHSPSTYLKHKPRFTTATRT